MMGPYRGFTQGGVHVLIRPSHRLRLFSSHDYSSNGASISLKMRSLVHAFV